MEGHGEGDEGHGEESQGEGAFANMSPAEIEALQKKNCVFCHIASGRVPAKKVYEDNECLAVLDINPANPGHVLLMPKEHYTIMFQVPESIIGHLFIVAKGLSQAGLKTFQSKGTTVFAANGTSAGQRAPHFMLHVIPRMGGDNIGLYIPSRALPEKEAEKIAAAVSMALGGKAVVKEPHEEKEASHEEKETPKAHEPKEKQEKLGKGAEKKEDKGGKGKPNLDNITDFLAKGGKK